MANSDVVDDSKLSESDQLRLQITNLKSINSKLQTQNDTLSTNYNELLSKHEKLLESIDITDNQQHHQNIAKSTSFWDDIYSKCRSDPLSIKKLISSGTLKMTDSNHLDRTLLLISAKKGSYELVELCLNLGANINHKDKGAKTAIDLAHDSGHYHIEQLLLFHKLNNKKMTEEIKENAFKINKQNGIINNILEQLSNYDETTRTFFKDTLIDIMRNIISKKLAFSDLLLNLCCKFIQQNDIDDNKIEESKLFNTILSTCTQIINQGNKRDWYWLEKFILPSTVKYIRTFYIFCILRNSNILTLFFVIF